MMILRFLPHSPYVRKVLVVAHETGQADDLTIETAHVFDPDTPLRAENPIGKVPALVRDDGSVLYDSTVIAEWLDVRAGTGLVPREGEARWDALRHNALGDGLGQAATWNIRERYRPDGERSPSYLDYYEGTIERCLAALEDEAPGADAAFDIGQISIACALSYIDFRYPDRGWRETYPALGAWADGVYARPSMQATELGPYDGPLKPA